MPRLPGLPAVLLAAALGCSACSAGTPDLVAVDPGHGSVNDVLAVLEAQRLPCLDPEPLLIDTAVSEERQECRLDGERVELLHFFTPEQARSFRRTTVQAGGHGAFADTWAAVTEGQDTARLIAGAVAGAAAE